MDRLENFIRFEFPDTWFTTQLLRDKYETVSDDIKVSTVSTYLSRMNRDGLLERKGNRNNRQYRLVTEVNNGLGNHEILQAKNRSAEGRW
jgi:predicted transcriptional regulator